METRNNINPRPFQPVSPDCILKEELEARSLPISDFAHKIGLEEFELDKLLNGTLCLSPEIASSLERFLGIPASFSLIVLYCINYLFLGDISLIMFIP